MSLKKFVDGLTQIDKTYTPEQIPVKADRHQKFA